MDRRYHNLLRKLEQQGYKQHFAVESIDLVEKLYIDLAQAKNFKYGHSNLNSLSKENAKLQKEIVKIKNDHEAQLKAHQDKVITIENEFSEYKLLNDQYILRIKQLEDQLKRTFSSALTAGNQFETNLETSRKSNLNKQNTDMLKTSEDKVARLQLEKDSLKIQLDHANQLLSHFKEQTGLKGISRDKQTKKLHNDHAVRGDLVNPCSDHLVAHLTFEMEHLQRLNFELETKLKDVISSEKESQWNEHKQLIDQNKQLEMNLVDVDKVAEALRKQKLELVTTADKEMNEAKEELKMLNDKMEKQEKDLSNLRKEFETMVNEKAETLASLAAVNAQVKTYENVIKSMEEENKRLNNAEKLVEENQPNSRAAGFSNLEHVIKSIEKQRDFYKKQLENISNRSQQARKANEQLASTPFFNSPNIYNENIQIQWNPLISFLEEERDAYKQECLRKSKSPDNKGNAQPQMAELAAKLKNITEENMELNKTLETLEKHIEEVNVSAEGLAAEKAALQKLYDKVLAAHEQQKEKAGQNLGSTLRDAIARVQADRDKALANFQRAEIEMEILRNKLKLATEAQMLERKRLEDKIIDLELRQGGERAELLSKITATEIQLFNLNDENQTLKNKIAELEAKFRGDRAKVDKLTRELSEKSEKALKDTERILIQKASERSIIEDKAKLLEKEIDELRKIIDRRDREIMDLKTSIMLLDKDRDKFQSDIDGKSEQVLSLTDTLNFKVKEEMDLKLKVADLEKQLDRMADEVMLKNREISNLKREVEYKKIEIEEFKRQCDEITLKYRQLNDDVMVLTKDNQTLQKDLKNSQVEKELLKREVQEYVNEVARVEQLLRAKEEERTEVLEQFKNLSVTTSSLEYQNNHLEVQASNSKMELISKQVEINHSKEVISSLNEEIKEYYSKQEKCEMELRNAQISLDNVLVKLKDRTQESERIQRELTALRELNVKLSSDKDKIAKELRSKEKERNVLENTLTETKHELDSSKIQLSAEKVAVKSLEQLLATNRNKDYEIQLSNRELTDELSILKEKLRQAESKLNELSTDVSKHRSRSVEQQLEIDRLKRQLTDARFEREKLNQDMQRLKQMSPQLTNPTYVVTTTVTETRTASDNPLVPSKSNKDAHANDRHFN